MIKKITFPKPEELLPHRAPMLLVDEIISYEPTVSLTASANVAKDIPFFGGHFPGQPILPGIVLIEMMFQTCGLFGRIEMIGDEKTQNQNGEGKQFMGRAIKIDKTTFQHPVYPDETVQIKVTFDKKIMNFSVYKGVVTNEKGQTVAKGIATVHIMEVEVEKNGK